MELRQENLTRSTNIAELNAKEVLTLDEAAMYTGIKKSTLYKLTSTQKIPFYKPFGRLCFFKREELQSWLLQNRVATTDEIAEKAQKYCLTGKRDNI